MIMRGLPFEDLSPQGKLAVIVSWALAAATCALIAIHYVGPRWPL